MFGPTRFSQCFRRGELTRAAAWLTAASWYLPAIVVVPGAAALAQGAPDPSAVSYGVELALRTGHADRGFVISDRPVLQPVTWVTLRGTTLSLWSNFTLSQTTDSARPQIVEVELGREYQQNRFAITPALRTYFYHDPLSAWSGRSIEGWVYLSYRAGPLRLFTNQSVDVWTYPGAYYGEAGVGFEGHVSPAVELGGATGAGWASAEFNEAWVEVSKPALNGVSVEGWLTAYVTPRFYISPNIEFSALLDRDLRAAATQPTFLFVRLATGLEF